MKQSKKLLSVLLALIMALSCLTVGASAYRADYSKAAGYNNVNQPYFTAEQAATVIMSDIDAVLRTKVHKTITIDELGVTVTIDSIDSALDFIYDIYSSEQYALLKEAGVIKDGDFGDLDALNKTIPMDKSFRRTSSTVSDLGLISGLIKFVSVNSSVLAKFINNTFDLGVLSKYWNISSTFPQLKDIHKWVNAKLYQEFMYSKLPNPNTTIDGTLQDFINNKCVSYLINMCASNGKNIVADYMCIPTDANGKCKTNMGLLQFCPSLTASQIDVTKVPFFGLVQNVYRAIVKDQLIPNWGTWEVKELGVNPNATSYKFKEYVDAIAVFLARSSKKLALPSSASNAEALKALCAFEGVANPSKPTALEELNAIVKFFFDITVHETIYFKTGSDGLRHLTINPDLASQVKSGVLAGIVAVGKFYDELPVPQSIKDTINAGKEDDGSIICAIARAFNAIYDGVMGEDELPEGIAGMRQLLTFVLADIAADLVPEADFYAQFESGKLKLGSGDAVMKIGGVILEYYLVKYMGMDKITTASHIAEPDEVTEKAFATFCAKYLTLFNVFSSEADMQAHKSDVWYILYNSVCQWVPLTRICVGFEDSPAGLKALFEKIFKSVKALDLNGVCSVISSTDSEVFKQPLSKMLVDFIASVANGIFKQPNRNKSDLSSNAAQKALVVPYTYTTLDQLFAVENTADGVNKGTGFMNTVANILKYAPVLDLDGTTTVLGKTFDNSLLKTLLPDMMYMLVDMDKYEYMNAFVRENCTKKGITYSMAELKDLYDELKVLTHSGNADLDYKDDAYSYFYEVDYAAWAYKGFTKALAEAKSIVEGKVSADSAKITAAYAALNQYYVLLGENVVEANDYQLNKVVTYANDEIGVVNETEEGVQAYTTETWADYEAALNFAVETEDHYAFGGCPQSKINESRRQLLTAIHNLEEYAGDGDYTELEAQLQRVLDIEISPKAFTDASVKAVVDAYVAGYNMDLEKPYDASKQDLIDEAADLLKTAIDSLERVPYIEFNDYDEGIKLNIDFENGYIYGFNKPIWTAQDQEDFGGDFETYFTSTFNAYMVVDPSLDTAIQYVAEGKGKGTSSKIQIVDLNSGKALAEYTVLMFGELNTDGFIDLFDLNDIVEVAGDIAEPYTGVFKVASDLDFDGMTDLFDTNILFEASGDMIVINQNPDYVATSKLTFAMLVEEAING